jgi:hydrogenase expression/formation protein HypC
MPGKLIELDSQNPQQAVVDVVGVRRRVDSGLLQEDPLVPGEWVLIHVGFAMSKISEAHAADQMRTLTMLGEAEAAIQEVRGYGLENEEKGQSGQRHSSHFSDLWLGILFGFPLGVNLFRDLLVLWQAEGAEVLFGVHPAFFAVDAHP